MPHDNLSTRNDPGAGSWSGPVQLPGATQSVMSVMVTPEAFVSLQTEPASGIVVPDSVFRQEMDPGRRSLGIAPISKGSEPVSVLLSRTVCSEKFGNTYPGGGVTSVSVCSPHFSSSSRKEPAPGSLSGPVHRLRSAAMQSVIASPPEAVGPFSVHSDSPISSPVSLSVLVHLAEAGLSLLTSST